MNTVHHPVEKESMQARVPRGWSIGAILIDAGKIKPADAERVLKLQHEEGLRFGDAAKRLKLVTDEDIELALSRQFDYPYLNRHNSKVSGEIIAAFEPFARQVEALRALRSQLMLRWFSPEVGRKSLAIVSAGDGEGRSWLAANLAVVFSQLGQRTLLIDADLRRPRQHALFGVDNRAGLSAVLTDRAGLDAALRVADLRDLSVMPAGAEAPNPQELLARPAYAKLMEALERQYDVVLVDTPSGNRYADGQMVAVRAGGALMVTRKNVSRIGLVAAYADMIRQGGASVVGSVLNER